jgi:cytidylate kinase
VVEAAERANIGFGHAASGQRVLLDAEDVTDAVREPEVTRLSSPVSAVSGVRRALVAHQRALAACGNVVMEGRDIGTVVLPGADLKVFLTASIGERACRRQSELAAKGICMNAEEVAEQIEERDQRDSTRDDSPLRPASDAVIIDTDPLTASEVVARVVELAVARR